MSNTIFHVSFPGLGIVNLVVDRVAFTLRLFGREFPIYWYGILIALGFGLAMLLSLKQSQSFGIPQNAILDSYLVILPVSMIGARLYYVIFDWSSFAGQWSLIFNTRYGGLAFYGGVIAGVLALMAAARYHRVRMARMFDFLVVYLPLGQAIGRWGNFFNQEAFGSNTSLPWGMISEGTYEHLAKFGNIYAPRSAVHPTFFYEFLGNLVIFFILYQLRKNTRYAWQTTAAYLTSYGVLRYFVEGIRTDALSLGETGIRVSQLLSLLMIFGGMAFMILASAKQQKSGVNGSPFLDETPEEASEELPEAEEPMPVEEGPEGESEA